MSVCYEVEQMHTRNLQVRDGLNGDHSPRFQARWRQEYLLGKHDNGKF